LRKKMIVAYILPYMRKPCGWRTFTIGAVNALQAYVEPHLFVEPEDQEAASKYFPNLEIYSLPATQQYTFANWRGWSQLFKCYREVNLRRYPMVDLVHSLEAYPSGLVGYWLSNRYNCPLVLTAHGTYAVIWHETSFDRWVYRRVLHNTSLICPVSRGTANLMDQYFGVDLQRARIVPIENGNDFYRSVSREKAFNREFPASPILLTVGEIKPRKGQATSLLAFAKVKKHFPSARYWLVGEYRKNEYFQTLQKIIMDNHIEDVEFFGRLSDEKLGECYRQASLFVLASHSMVAVEKNHFEGFGLVYLEAGAYGLPVIGTRYGGVPEAIREHETGLLVEPGDVDGLAEAISQLLSDPTLMSKMGNANRLWSETLTWERYANVQYKAYRKVLERS
jgi:phosphatidylinositol alpha-1,6-mannosyltransferase